MNGRTKLLVTVMAVALALCMGLVLYLGIQSMNSTVSAYAPDASQQMNTAERFRTVREQLRSLQKAQLNDIIHDAETDEELVSMAKRRLLEMCSCEEQEMTIEGILSMWGWKGSVVTVHSQSVNVLLPAESLNMQESSMILDLVCRETGVQSGNVKIIPIK